VPIYLTRPDGQKTSADDDADAARLEALGFVRDDAPQPKKRTPRKTAPKVDA